MQLFSFQGKHYVLTCSVHYLIGPPFLLDILVAM